MVATFLAVLELAKDKKVMVSGDGGDTSIELLSADFGDTVSEEWE
jgi:chromatin segregation and condensation protein Rec8/ScpA/Scc1 (kleisin family)